ncbi:ESCRT-II complex, vps25 subunit [Thozetella sp. PMI_491]|nr:ESCRT-II complex, vps25 subunit [Thozetella sp. PMI_491]
MASATPDFQWPREYAFPPFFNRQPNAQTHHAQLLKWSALFLAYCKHHRVFKLSLSGAPTTAAPAADLGISTGAGAGAGATAEELFYNKKINRRLHLDDAREVVDFMRKSGQAEWVGTANKDVAWIYWRTPDEWAALVEAWVDDTAQKGTVLTLYELTESDATRGQDFHGLDLELLQKALNILVKRGKAQIFGQEDSQGVKFF